MPRITPPRERMREPVVLAILCAGLVGVGEGGVLKRWVWVPGRTLSLHGVDRAGPVKGYLLDAKETMTEKYGLAGLTTAINSYSISSVSQLNVTNLHTANRTSRKGEQLSSEFMLTNPHYPYADPHSDWLPSSPPKLPPIRYLEHQNPSRETTCRTRVLCLRRIRNHGGHRSCRAPATLQRPVVAGSTFARATSECQSGLDPENEIECCGGEDVSEFSAGYDTF